MAGYVFAIGGDEDPVSMIRECAEKGIYSTYLKGIAPLSFEGTLADYMSMKPGDNIYFFCKRRYYGIGELISIGPDCKYCNYPRSSARVNVRYEDISNDLLVNFGSQSPHYRWLCTFKGAPYFFEEGIDTDEILTYKPNTFKMLRAFWKVSFIKLSDEENASLKEIFLLRRQRETAAQTGIFPERNDIHNAIAAKVLDRYLIKPADMLQTCIFGSRVKHEMALEAAVVYDLCHNRVHALGAWDYVSHQVIASPFKPIDYMAPADNPFEVYNFLEKKYADEPSICISPLATKPVALGVCMFALNYEKVRIVYPISDVYSSHVTNQVTKILVYEISLT